MDLSVVVPIFNARAHLPDFVDAISAQEDPGGRWELVLVDDGSTDGGLEGLPLPGNARVLTRTRGGPYAARNTGIEAARGDIVAFTDPDCAPAPSWLRIAAETLAEPEAGIVLGHTRSGPDGSHPSLDLLDAYERAKERYVYGLGDPTLYFARANNMAVRRRLLAPPFEPRARGADILLVRRLVERHSPAIVCHRPDMVVRHLEIRSAADHLRKYRAYGTSLALVGREVRIRSLGPRRLAILRDAVRAEDLSLLDAVRLFGLLSRGMAEWSLGVSRAFFHTTEPAFYGTGLPRVAGGRTIPAPGEPAEVSVVLPVGPDAPHLAACLGSLAALDPRPGEIVVVLDGHDPAEGAAWPEGAVVVERPAPGGPAVARNDGAARATEAVLLFLDADILAPVDLVARVAAAFADPELDALIGSYDDAPADPRFLSQYRNLLHHWVHQTSRREASTFWGACGAVRRSAFEAVGGFDPAYRRASIEDIELGYRLTDAGHRIRLDPSLQVTHMKRWTALDMVRTDVLRRGVPWARLLLERGMSDDLNVRVADRFRVLLAGALVPAALFLPWPAVGGLFAALALSDLPFHAFLARRRGPLFALAAVPWRAFFHFYSGVAFGVALASKALPSAPPSGGASVT